MTHRPEQSTTDKQRELKHALLLAISRAQEHVIQQSNPKQLYDLLLSDFIALTQSEFGFMGAVLYRTNGAPYLKTHAMTNIAWNAESRALYAARAAEGLETDNLDNLFGAVITSGEAVLSNDPSSDPRSTGTPAGHPKIHAFLGLPVYHGEKLMGMVGVANRPGGYNHAIIDKLKPLLRTYGQIIESLRQNQLRSRADQQLRDSEQRFKALVESAPDAFFLHNRTGKLIDVNEQACASVGYSRDALLNMSILDIARNATPEDIEEIWRKLAEGEKVSFKSAYFRKNSSYFPVDLNITSVQSGPDLLVLVLARDITQTQAAEKNLRRAFTEMEQRVTERTRHLTTVNNKLEKEIHNHLKTQQQLIQERDFNSTIFEMVAALLILLDPQGRIIKLNRASESTSGFKTSEVKGKTFWQTFICEGETDAVQQHLLHAPEIDNKKKRHTNCWHTRNGDLTLISWSHANIYDNDGNIKYLVVTGIDITEQQATESKLRENVRQLNTLDHINSISMKAGSIDTMLSEVLDEMLHIFNCDHVWLLYPCDPNAPAWVVPMERARPGWATTNAQQPKIDMDDDDKEIFLNALNHDVVTYDQHSKLSLPKTTKENYHVLCQMDCAIFPKTGKPWLIGLHHCQEQHDFTSEERRILRQIAERLSQALTNLLILKDLRESESEHKALFQNMTQGVVYQNNEGKVLSANPAALEILGLTLEQLQGRTSYDPRWQSMHEDGRDYPGDSHPSMLALKTGKPVTGAIMGVFNPNTEQTRWLIIDAIPQFKDDENTPYQVFTTFNDITARKLAEDKLRLSAAVVENSGDAILIGDASGNLVTVNQAYMTMTGFNESEVIHKPVQIKSSDPAQSDICNIIMETVVHHGQWQGEILIVRKDGKHIPTWTTVSAVYDEQDRLSHCVSVATDISAIKRSQQQLDFLAYHDPLTNLPNRLLLDDRLNHALQRARREHTKVAVLFLDLDRFKNINDSLGHPVGDKLLKQASMRLRDLTRHNDTVARLGGDEFVIIVEEITEAIDVATLAQKVIIELSRPFTVKGHVLHLTTSIGISIYPADGQDAETLIKNADAAMYRAKEDGRNGYHFYTMALTDAVYEHLTMETALRHALDNNELILHYQPQIDVNANKLIGVEALVRWIHPEQGLVYPEKFITLAEESGLIIPLGEWVLWTACKQMQEWRKIGIAPPKVTVNVSGVQFYRGGIVKMIKRILHKTGLPPTSLELEITESVVMQKTESTIDTMNQLRQMGVSISIDDFGTGYSSLSYLKRMPVNKLKIDQSFVQDLPHDGNDEAIAKAIIALANSLQLVVLAEGVETAEQRDHLQKLGCDLFQGIFFSAPLNTKTINNYMSELIN